MDTSQDYSRQSQLQALQNTTGLTQAYLTLEGFVESDPTSSTHVSTPETQQPENCWTDILVTCGVIFGCLVTSSVALGFGASRLSQGIQQLGSHVYHQSTDSISTPTRWRF